MADNNFRNFRREPLARDAGSSQRDAVSDPLAELARLIGQSDSHRGFGRDADPPPAQEFDDVAPAALDWAASDQNYAQHAQAEESYQPQSAGDESWPRGRAYEEEPAAAKQYVRPPVGFDGAGRDPGRHAGTQDDQFDTRSRSPGSRAEPVPYIPPAHGGYLADDRGQFGGQAPDWPEDSENDTHDQYDEEPAPLRRSGTVVLVAVLGVAVLGTAGALGYHAMFGGSMIPSLPPIIMPSDTPVKIVPKHDTEAGSLSQAAAGKKGGDQLVTHEEQPVDVQTANPVPHVVTTIPVISNAPDAPLPDGGFPGSAEPGSPPPAPSPFGDSNSPVEQFGAAMPPASTEPVPSEAAPGSKPVRTVTILPQQRPASAEEPSPLPPSAPAQARPVKVRKPFARPVRDERTASAGPLSIMPDQGGRAASQPPARAPRMTTAREEAPMPLTSGAKEPAEAARGGYAVQVTSRRSEAEAQAAFRSLQARYPRQLGGQPAFVRRADLGAKGVYYRALVGPFASAQQAASLCSGLKAAGGSCLIQRN